ncbi:DUF6093 family protein [Segeticoccus rhizosphaerae]|uniref:DUF6093 family protein n=1 Tax=Segeticoccus rhizosphaerae TaxID=1104777 RepID=UPI001396CE3F|nr:DUF6093 family protein [Segeticoccus rhizosphaerae]
MPFTSTRVIHPNWSTHHQATAQGGMTATCRIEVPGVGTTWDEVNEETIPAPATVIAPSGTPCRVQEIDSATNATQAAQDVSVRRYLVAVPAGVRTAEQGAHVVIEACSNDARLVGRHLFIVDVQSASERFERDYVCTDNLG